MPAMLSRSSPTKSVETEKVVVGKANVYLSAAGGAEKVTTLSWQGSKVLQRGRGWREGVERWRERGGRGRKAVSGGGVASTERRGEE